MPRPTNLTAFTILVLVIVSVLVGVMGLRPGATGRAFEQHDCFLSRLWPQHRWKSDSPNPDLGEKQKGMTPGAAPEANSNLAESPVGPLPWANDPSFQRALRENGTPVLMAAYKATLPDPIENERYNIALAAEMLAGTVVQPGEIFSQNRCLGPYTEARGFRAGPTYSGGRITTTTGGGVCKIASLLYNVAILSNVEIVERHPHSLTVPYVPPGQDATVSYGTYDFRFRNNTEGPILIWAQNVGDTLYVAFYGQKKPPRVTWHHKTLRHIKTWTEYRYNPSLPAGSQRVVMPGQDGIVVRSWITISMPDGQATTRDLGVDYYNPSPHIVERGPRA